VSIQVITTAPDGIFDDTGLQAAHAPFEVLRDRVRRGERSLDATVSMTALLRTITEKAMRSRSTVEDWNCARDRVREATEAIEQKHGRGFVPSVNEATQDFELRSRMWIREYERWSELRDGRLCDAALETWERLMFLQDYLKDHPVD
jgi:hypothetical protein